MPRRVLLMISSMRGGGSERQTLLLLRHLDREKFTPHLYVTEQVGDLMGLLPTDVQVHSFDSQPQGGFYFPGRVLRRQIAHLRKLIQRESIDAIYDRTFHMTLIAGPAAASTGIPRVSTIVSPPHRALPLVESRFVWLKKRRLSSAYRKSRSVIAVSEQAAKSARDYYGLPANDVKTIMNPVDIHAVRLASLKKRPAKGNRTTLVCVGRMTSEKGHHDLIKAIALTELQWPTNTPPIAVRMIGDGPLRSELETQARETVKRHEIQFCGISSNPAPEIASADALVLPSHFEGMPNVVLESMAIGTPVIATRAGGTVELQRGEPTMLWANPQDPASLRDAILQFVDHRGEVSAYTDAATRLVESHHDVRVTTRKIEQLLS